MQWRAFLRALADDLDSTLEPEAKAALLRRVGRRMAAMMPLPGATSLETLELEMNEGLGTLGWGSVGFDLREADHCLMLHHTGLPRLGTGGDPPGAWLAPTLEGLYEGWMSQQPGSEPSLTARIEPSVSPGIVTLKYGRS